MQSYVRMLELIHKMLPHVTALNLQTPSEEPPSPPGQYYTWVESQHPYQQSSVSNMRLDTIRETKYALTSYLVCCFVQPTPPYQ